MRVELYERVMAMQASRRRFMQGAAALAAGTALSSSFAGRAFAAAEKKIDRALTSIHRKEAKQEIASLELRHEGNTIRLAKQLEELTHLESRVTILGYVQRGGTPCSADRLLATRLGSAAADLINEEHYGVMVAARGDGTEPVPLEKVAGKRKCVPPDHSWVQTARHVGTCMGD